MTYLAATLGTLGGFLLGAVIPSPLFWLAVAGALVAWRWKRGAA